MRKFHIQTVDLKSVKSRNSIQVLRTEKLYIWQYGPDFFATVRYARDGVEQERKGFPLDLGKGIFIATLEDHELNGLCRYELDKNLGAAAAEIVELMRKSHMPGILGGFLQDYDDFESDISGSEPPNLLRCRVLESQSPQSPQSLFELARRFSILTREPYRIASYGATYPNGENEDEVWREFSLTHCTDADGREMPPKMLAEASQKAVASLIRRRKETPLLLQTILADCGNHLAYDARESHPPNFLKCRVTNPEHPRHEREMFEIARQLSVETGKDYSIASYGGAYDGEQRFDEVWTHFTLRILNFYQ